MERPGASIPAYLLRTALVSFNFHSANNFSQGQQSLRVGKIIIKNGIMFNRLMQRLSHLLVVKF